jgi:hypothetical protein
MEKEMLEYNKGLIEYIFKLFTGRDITSEEFSTYLDELEKSTLYEFTIKSFIIRHNIPIVFNPQIDKLK